MVFKQEIGIPMVIDTAAFWANLFLYFFESKPVQNFISKNKLELRNTMLLVLVDS